MKDFPKTFTFPLASGAGAGHCFSVQTRGGCEVYANAFANTDQFPGHVASWEAVEHLQRHNTAHHTVSEIHPQQSCKADGGLFLYRHSSARRAVSLNPRVVRVAPFGHQPAIAYSVSLPPLYPAFRAAGKQGEIPCASGEWTERTGACKPSPATPKNTFSKLVVPRQLIGQGPDRACAAEFPANVLCRKAGLSIYWTGLNTYSTGTGSKPINTCWYMNISSTEHTCKACGAVHPLAYFLFADGSRHLHYRCPVTKQFFLLPYRAGLAIPEIKSRKLAQADLLANQPELL